MHAFTRSVQTCIQEAMARHGVNRAELARRVGLSKPRMTQLFGPHPNMTLETVARLFDALGERPRLVSERAVMPLAEDW